MTTAVAVTTIITGAMVKLAGIGAVLKLLLALVPRLQIAAPKAPQVRVKVIDEAEVPAAASKPPVSLADQDRGAA